MPAGMRKGLRLSSSTPTAADTKKDKNLCDTLLLLLLLLLLRSDDGKRSEEEDSRDRSSSDASPHRNRAGIK